MSVEVDHKIVEMKFDNKQFEEGIKHSMGTLKRFKESLEMNSAAKEFKKLQEVTDRYSMASVAKSVEDISKRFSTMGIAGTTVLAKLAYQADELKNKIVSAFAIEPIRSGFEEYETQINSVQTILANTQSKGSTLSDVNAALDELNKYADKTIYNFTEMTRNIGTFTAAGVGLEDATSAIKGIANLAAVSGSTSQQASTAMYQLSQALAAGKVQLQDWNSVVNAGMGGQVFQDALKETARAHKINVDGLIETYGSFRESLTEGAWLSSEILLETLQKFTGDLTEAQLKSMGYTEKQIKGIVEMGKTASDAATKVKTATQLWDTLKEAAQSGWTETWEIIVGDFEEAKEFYTQISDELGGLIGLMSESRNQPLSEGLSSGWGHLLRETGADETRMIKAMSDAAKKHGIAVDELTEKYGGFQNAVKHGLLTGDAFKDGIASLALEVENLSEDQLRENGLTVEYKDNIMSLNEELKNNTKYTETYLNLLTRETGREKLVKSLFNVYDGLKNVFKGIAEAYREVFSAITGDQIYSFTEKILEVTETFKKTFAVGSTSTESIKAVFKVIFRFADMLLKIAKSVASVIGNVASKAMPLVTVFLNIIGVISSFVASLFDVSYAGDAFVVIADSLNAVIDKTADKMKLLVGYIAGVVEELTGIDITNMAQMTELTGKMAKKIASFAKSAYGKLSSVSTVVEYIKNAFVTMARTASSGIDKAGEKIDVFRSHMESAKRSITELSAKLAELFAPVGEKLKNLFGNVTITDIIGTGFLAGLYKVFKSFSKQTESITESVKSVLEEAGNSLKKFQNKIDSESMKSIAFSVAALAGALLLLSQVDDMAHLGVGLAGVSALLTEVMISMKVLSKMKIDTKALTKTAGVMIVMSLAIDVLAKALARFNGSIEDPNNLYSAAISMSFMFATIGVVLKALSTVDSSGASGILKISSALILMAQATGMLAESIEAYDRINTKALIKGISSIGIIFLEIAAVARFSADSKFKGIQSSIMGLAFSMIILSGAIKLFAMIPTDEIIKGMLSVSVIMGEFIALVGVMAFGKAKISGVSGTIISIATSMTVLAGAVKLFGIMPIGDLVKGLGVVTVLLTGMGIFIMSVSKMKANIVGVAGALVAMSVAMNLLVAPILILGALPWKVVAFGIISIVSAMGVLAAASALLSPISKAMGSLAKSMAMFGAAALGIGVAIAALAFAFGILATAGAAGIAGVLASIAGLLKGITLMSPLIEESIIAIGTVVCNAIIHLAPAIAEALMVLIDSALISLDNHIPSIVEHLISIFGKVFSALGNSSEQGAIILIGGALAIAATVKIMASAAKDAKKAVIGAAISVAVVSMLSGVLVVMSMMPVDNALPVAASLSSILTSMGISMKIMSTLPVGGAISAVKSLGIFIAGFAGILVALGAISSIPGIDWLVDHGIGMLQTIGNGLGIAVGSIIGGLGKGITDGLPEIGENLSGFMSSMSTIEEGTAKSVEEVASAILTLTGASLLKRLGKFLGTRSSFEGFGRELVNFAPYMAEFYQETRDIKGDSFSEVTRAISELIGMASDIPNSGGAISLLVGDNKLSKFGKELAIFGPFFSEFAKSVENVDTDTVLSANAAMKSVSEMAKWAPNTGGIIGMFSGNNDLGHFGEELASFGDGLSVYSETLKGVDLQVIDKANTAILGIMKFANHKELGKSQIKKFGGYLKDFGKNYSEYYSSISVVDNAKVEASVDQVRSLIKLAIDISSAKIAKFSTFPSDLAKISHAGVDEFVEAFEHGKDEAVSSIKRMIDACGEAIDTKYYGFYTAGSHMAEGFAKGIDSKKFLVEAKSKAMAEAALEAAKKALDEHSPSRETFKIGKNAILGLVNALSDPEGLVPAAMTDTTNEMLREFNRAVHDVYQYVDDSFDHTPTIRPVIDMSDVYASEREMNKYFGKRRYVGTSSMLAVQAIRTEHSSNTHGSNATSNSSVVNNFTQYNYSPKALSKTEIYRQSKNLFSAKKGVVRAR